MKKSIWVELGGAGVLVAVWLMACAEGETPVACRVGADCVSGSCADDGRCGVPPQLLARDAGEGAADGGSAAGPGAIRDGGNPSDGGTGEPGSGGAAAPADAGRADGGVILGCRPNFDGVIARNEVPVMPGVHASYLTSGVTAFDAGGSAASDGGRFWNFNVALPGDRAVRVETLPVSGSWFAADFPEAEYAAPLGQGTALLGVFKATPDALVMLGVVSPPDGGTTLKYSPPVKVLEFPFKLGSSWKTSAAASGTYQGQVVSYGLVVGTLPYMTDTYTSVVDLSGEASTPYATFPVLRVRTVMERTVGLFPFAFPYSAATVRSFLYATECFGGVATVTAKAGERESEPTEFGEVRRLAP